MKAREIKGEESQEGLLYLFCLALVDGLEGVCFLVPTRHDIVYSWTSSWIFNNKIYSHITPTIKLNFDKLI